MNNQWNRFRAACRRAWRNTVHAWQAITFLLRLGFKLAPVGIGIALGITGAIAWEVNISRPDAAWAYVKPEVRQALRDRADGCGLTYLGLRYNETLCNASNKSDPAGAEVAQTAPVPKPHGSDLLATLPAIDLPQPPSLMGPPSLPPQQITPSHSPRFQLASISKNGGADCVVSAVKVPSRYLGYICDASDHYGINANVLASQLFGENPRWNPNARSYKGAKGLAQIMPAVAKAAGVDPTDPEQSIHYMARRVSRTIAYWQRKGYSQYHATILAWAQYNGGPKAQNWVIAHGFKIKRDRWAPIHLWRNQTAGYILDNLARCGQYLTETV